MAEHLVQATRATPTHHAPPWLRRLPRLGARLFTHLVLAAGSALLSFPFAWMLSTSLKLSVETFDYPPKLIPSVLVWENYTAAITYGFLLRGALNSSIIVSFNILGEFFVASMVAYSFARLRWPGRDICFVLMLSTMMLPGAVTMVPLFILFKQLGWVNTFLPLIVPAFGGSPFYIFLLRQFFTTIPRDLEDAARIDGASIPQIWAQIMMPLIAPALAAVCIFTFRATWNDFMGPLIYIDSPSLRPMSLALFSFRQEHGTDWNTLMAASTLMTLPVVLVFFFFQRYFIQGITLTGIKG